MAINEHVDAKKDTIAAGIVWEFLQNAETVYVASGKNILEYKPSAGVKEELLKKATGRTGNLRAPAVRIGGKIYVGFNQEMYDQLAG